IGFGGESARNSKRKSNFWFPVCDSRNRGKTNVINLGIRAPGIASGDRDLELAREVIKICIACEQIGDLGDKRRRIRDLIGIDTSHRAAGYITYDVAAGSSRI